MSSQSVKDALDCISGERCTLSSDRRVAAFPWLVAAVVLLLMVVFGQLFYPKIRHLSANEHRVVSTLVQNVAAAQQADPRLVWRELSAALGVSSPDQMRGRHYEPAAIYLLTKIEGVTDAAQR